jgi:hypothetical protein
VAFEIKSDLDTIPHPSCRNLSYMGCVTMKRPRFSLTLALFASGGFLVPSGIVAAAETPSAQQPAPAIHDIALGEQGTLQGIVVNGEGRPMAKATVVVRQGKVPAGQAVTAENGQFRVQGLKGGVYEVASGQGAGTFRLWADKTAPPAAKNGVLVVAQPLTVRGQMPLETFLTSDAFVLTAIGVAAVAIPVAIHNARDDKKSGS